MLGHAGLGKGQDGLGTRRWASGDRNVSHNEAMQFRVSANLSPRKGRRKDEPVHFFPHRSALRALIPVRTHLFHRMRHPSFKTRTNLPSRFIRDTDEVIGRCRPLILLVSHVDKVVLRPLCGTEIDETPGMDYSNLVEELVEKLGSLVDGNDRGEAEIISRKPEGAHELKRGGRIKTTRRTRLDASCISTIVAFRRR